MSESKPNVLILGGCGFIGRNMVKFLVDNKLASHIRVADKKMPVSNNFHADHQAAFNDKKLVSFKQSDVSRAASVTKLFADMKFDYVVNLCAETRPAMNDGDYKLKCLTTAINAAGVVAEQKVKKWVEMSHGQIYKPDKRASTEDSKIAPWTIQAGYRYQAEEALRKIQGLPMVVLRPAMVYGPGDLTSLTPRLACAAAYQLKKETLKFLWSGDMKINTVHVADVCKAIWHACTTLEAGTVYNLADSSDMTAGKLNKAMAKLFGIKTGFVGSLLSRAAVKFNAASIANEKHSPMWRAVMIDKKVNLNSPVSTYIDEENVQNKHISINGTKITGTGFTYDHPACTVAEIRAAVEFQIAQNIFPACLV